MHGEGATIFTLIVEQQVAERAPGDGSH
jgi:hypothetical protein